MGVGGQHHAPAAFTPGKDPVSIVQEVGWASEPVCRGAENLAATGIRFPDLPVRSESLYRLSHPGCPCLLINVCNLLKQSTHVSSGMYAATCFGTRGSSTG